MAYFVYQREFQTQREATMKSLIKLSSVRSAKGVRAAWRRCPCSMAEVSVQHGGGVRAAWRRCPCSMVEVSVQHGGGVVHDQVLGVLIGSSIGHHSCNTGVYCYRCLIAVLWSENFARK